MHLILKFHRVSRFFYLKGFFHLSKLVSSCIRIIFACDLKGSVKVDKEVLFYHNGLGVVIHSKAHLRKGVSIYQNVTIGGNGKEEHLNGVPDIGENVTLSAGSVVIGPISIGKNSIVAANAVVDKNVPQNCLVGGVPAKIIKYLDIE